jgi:biopolymer transport protein ExbD
MDLRRKRHNFAIPMNSMSDVAFLLLIFIMLVALINYRKEVKVDYPEAQNAARVSSKKDVAIWIKKDGSTFLNGNPCTAKDIENKVIDIYNNAPDTKIEIIADKNTPYKNVNAVLSVLQTVEYRVVSFVVKNNEFREQRTGNREK